jgi:hypothetical protein
MESVATSSSQSQQKHTVHHPQRQQCSVRNPVLPSSNRHTHTNTLPATSHIQSQRRSDFTPKHNQREFMLYSNVDKALRYATDFRPWCPKSTSASYYTRSTHWNRQHNTACLTLLTHLYDNTYGTITEAELDKNLDRMKSQWTPPHTHSHPSRSSSHISKMEWISSRREETHPRDHPRFASPATSYQRQVTSMS